MLGTLLQTASLAGGVRDLESQYMTAQGEVGTGSETRSLREKYGSMSSLGTGGQPTPPTQSAGPSAAPSAAPSAGTVSSGGGRRVMRGASQEALALRSSQQAFRGLAAGVSQLSRGDSQLHSTGSMAGPTRTRSTAGAPNPLRQSLTASTGCNGGSTLSGSVLAASAAGATAGATFASATPVLGDAHYTLKSTSSSGHGGSRPDSAANSSSNNSGERGGCELRGWLPLSCDVQPHRQRMEYMEALTHPPTCPSLCLPAAGASSGNAQPAASALDSSHLVAESPAMVEAASMAVHPFMSPHPSMPVSPAQVGGGAPSIAHLAGVMMQVGAGLPGCRCCRAILPCSSPCSAAVCSALHASAPQLRRPH